MPLVQAWQFQVPHHPDGVDAHQDVLFDIKPVFYIRQIVMYSLLVYLYAIYIYM